MNRTLTIVIEDKKKATEAGLIQKIGTYLKKKLAPNKYIVDQLRNGDAIIVDLGKKSYQVEQQFVEFITPTSYRRTPRSQNVALEDTLFLMRDNQRIFSMLEDLLDIANDERTVIRVQVEPKKPTIQKVNIRTVDRIYIHGNYVRVGWNSYAIKYDWMTGKNFVTIDGYTYEVKTDWFGRRYLSE